jgi:hypothetical protein
MGEPTDVQVWGIAMMRDEEDVAGAVIEHMVGEGLNGIIVADNGSVDRTRQELLDRVDWAAAKGCRLVVQDDPERGYYQSAKMSRLADQAAAEGATWIVPFDADEIWVSHRDRVAAVLREASADVAQAVLFNHFCTRVDDPAESNPFLRLRWPSGIRKVPGSIRATMGSISRLGARRRTTSSKSGTSRTGQRSSSSARRSTVARRMRPPIFPRPRALTGASTRRFTMAVGTLS